MFGQRPILFENPGRNLQELIVYYFNIHSIQQLTKLDFY